MGVQHVPAVCCAAWMIQHWPSSFPSHLLVMSWTVNHLVGLYYSNLATMKPLAVAVVAMPSHLEEEACKSSRQVEDDSSMVHNSHPVDNAPPQATWSWYVVANNSKLWVSFPDRTHQRRVAWVTLGTDMDYSASS
mmetsp:Transcript_25400/g.39017  ORF Transcript_25400/g.39017 Transcript_25400/m.39017 type:complete len:135 (+) Transcript_25400:258-662(+)